MFYLCIEWCLNAQDFFWLINVLLLLLLTGNLVFANTLKIYLIYDNVKDCLFTYWLNFSKNNIFEKIWDFFAFINLICLAFMHFYINLFFSTSFFTLKIMKLCYSIKNSTKLKSKYHESLCFFPLFCTNDKFEKNPPIGLSLACDCLRVAEESP